MLKDSLTESETTNNSEKIYSPTNVEGLISKILDRQIIVDYFILTKGDTVLMIQYFGYSLQC
jgi:hypothetical protein